ncbi:MAG: hypothetical protein GF344_12550 [Chitinivibrionales bacterium]|nr:hypothetical protein [Chitinivibrionales bacterium]MBD3357581.1 hypothetical protein [Chitinivibrionales bacterium]
MHRRGHGQFCCEAGLRRRAFAGVGGSYTSIVFQPKRRFPAGFSPKEQAPADYEKRLAALGNDPALFGELNDILVSRWQDLVSQAERAHEAADYEALARILHTIKGSVNVFAFDGFTEEISKHIETARRSALPKSEDWRALLEKQEKYQRALKEENEARNT